MAMAWRPARLARRLLMRTMEMEKIRTHRSRQMLMMMMMRRRRRSIYIRIRWAAA
jgi:hypothetical protein